ncbi:site-specific integrase [Maribellus sp. YY47]|uniref:site-specific integrase n=1 Tax=Maribellus sp. YY47 TaxID=2929486 RepID=UPI002000A0EF|nr:site-specific integrase [Maribellus sp. YY47]MCK3683967.1 site-specific integrase [Maribellus sp. YY47]
MIGVTTSIVLDTRVQRADETYAVKLRITYKRQQKYYPIGIWLNEEAWQRTQQDNPRKGYKENKLYFNEIEKRAIDIIKQLHPFSFSGFKRKFNQDSQQQLDTVELFNEYIKKMKDEERFGSAASYSDALTSIQKFLATQKRKKLMVWDITPEWLQGYEDWMKAQKRASSTIGIYLRSLRTIVNIAIENGSISREDYPFGKRKYQIPASQNVKKALTLSDIKKIVEYEPRSRFQERARDIWLLSYLCNGINFKDLALLQNKNLAGNKVIFIRSKTENSTKQELKPVTIIQTEEIKNIIAKWRADTKDPDDFVFPFISHNDPPEQRHNKIKNITKKINKHMKNIGEVLKLEMKITTYTARHSFATVLKRSGAPIEFISESLGHKDLKTTENYLDSFEDDVKEAYQRKLLDF